MFAVPLGRILWKEYRAQRTLWLACAGLGCLFEILIACFIGYDTSIMVGVPSMLALCYGAACSAVLFAGEREERTSDWLLNLSVPPGVLVTGKIGFAVLATLALQWVIAVPCLLLMRPGGFMTQHIQALFFPLGLVGLAWTLLGSLTSRRVLVSIASMTAWWGLTFLPAMAIVSNYSLDSASSRPAQIVGIFLIDFFVVATFVASVAVAWRWSKGQYLDGSIFERWQLQNTGKFKVLSGIQWKRRSLSRRIENEQSWRRTWQRLIWHERHRESLHLTLLAIGCLAGFAIPIDGLSINKALGNLVLSGSLALPMAMGVLAFEPTRTKPQSFFLINRGVAPGVVWLAKNVVWLARAFWIPAVILTVGYWCERFVNPLVPGGYSQSQPLQELYQRIATRPDLAVSYVLLCYGSGQLAATLLQSAILAGALGVLLNIVAASWLLTADWMALPLWWFWGIPLVAFPLISFWQMRARMLDDQSWSRRAKLYGAVAAVPIVLLISLSAYRVYEVDALTRVDSSLRIQSGILSRELVNANRPSPLDSAFGNRVVEMLKSRDDHMVVADQLVELLNSEPDVRSLFRAVTNSSYEAILTSLRGAVLVRANQQMHARERDRSFNSLLASLKLARLLAKDQGLKEKWSKWSGSQFDVLDELVNWANAPFQTPGSIREGMQAIEAELKRFPAATEAIVASYQRDKEVTEATSIQQVNDYALDGTHLIPSGAPDLIGILYFPWERTRLKKLMEREAEFLFANAWSLETQLKEVRLDLVSQSNVQSVHPFSNQRQMFARAYTVRDLNRKLILQRATEIRAALLRMELIAFRLEHQRLPTALVELLETANPVKIIDPWSNRLFDYYPTFLLSTVGRGTALMPVSATHLQFKNDDNSEMMPGVAPMTPQQVLQPSAIETIIPVTEVQTRKLEWVRPSRALFMIPEQIKTPVGP